MDKNIKLIETLRASAPRTYDFLRGQALAVGGYDDFDNGHLSILADNIYLTLLHTLASATNRSNNDPEQRILREVIEVIDYTNLATSFCEYVRRS
jgi:hypothetical protein